MNNPSHQIVLCTCPDEKTAAEIARVLVDEGLAACVNSNPVRSVYRWKGQTESANEYQLVIKSRSDRYAQIQKRILEMHPYELPEIIGVPIVTGLKPYLSWLDNPDS